MDFFRGRVGGFLVLVVSALALFSCEGLASNGIFNLNAAQSENWLSGMKFSVRTDYPMPAAGTGQAKSFPDFSKERDIIAWAIYYDGSSQLVPSRDLAVAVNGEYVGAYPVDLNFIGKAPVVITYRNNPSFEYYIVVGNSGGSSDGGGGSDDGTGISIIITF